MSARLAAAVPYVSMVAASHVIAARDQIAGLKHVGRLWDRRRIVLATLNRARSGAAAGAGIVPRASVGARVRSRHTAVVVAVGIWREVAFAHRETRQATAGGAGVHQDAVSGVVEARGREIVVRRVAWRSGRRSRRFNPRHPA
jgi:hypothetical protein